MTTSQVKRVVALTVMMVPIFEIPTVMGNQIANTPQNLRFEFVFRAAHRDEVLEAGGQKMNMGANLRHSLKGRVIWRRWDPNGFEFDLHVERVEYGFVDPQPVNQMEAVKIKPFTARVMMSRGDGGMLSIDFVQGRDQDPYGAGRQDSMAREVLDMMCATVVRKEFTPVAPEPPAQVVKVETVGEDVVRTDVTPPRSISTDMVSLIYPTKTTVEGYDVPARRARLPYVPRQYAVVPGISADGARTVELLAYERSKMRIRLSRWTLDPRTELAIYAVNLDAVRRTEVKEEDQWELLRLLDKPHEFASYTLYELKVAVETK